MVNDDVTTTVLVNGRIWTGAGAPAASRRHALAVVDGVIAAVGDDDEVCRRFPAAPPIDLGGRTVVPGLIDAHNHATRGGATWGSELHWTLLTSGAQARDSIRAAAAAAGPRAWITAIGGWHQTQFADGWTPTRADLDAAAPDNPVYVQSLYEFGVANSAALARVDLAAHAPGLPDGVVERDVHGAPSGVVRGLPGFNLFLAAVGSPGADQQAAGLRAMVRDYAALGLTGVCDPGGFGMSPDRYATLRRVHEAGELGIRMRLYGSATTPGREIAQVDEWLDDIAADVGDDWLRSVGIGEVVHFGCHDFEGLDEFAISADARQELAVISRAVAAHGLPMHIHAVMDDSIAAILDCWERIDRTTPLRPLRFSIAHADRISPTNIARAAALGVGLVIDARLTMRAAASRSVWGADALRDAPRVRDMVAAGLPLGVGSDATRASSYNPWLATWWLVAGRSLDGGSQRDAAQLLDRATALSLQTVGGAWFSFEEGRRGRLLPGWLADLAVLDDDCFAVPVDDLPGLRSELTMVGGRVAFSSGAVAPAG